MTTLARLVAQVGVDASNFDSELTRAERRMDAFGSNLKSIGMALSLGITAPLVAFVKAASDAAGGFEQTTIAFNTMLGSASKAKAMLDDLQNLALTTPFQFKDLLQGTRTLLGYGFAAQQVHPMLVNLGNAISSIGGSGETLREVIVQLGQMRTIGKAYMQDLKPLASQGVRVFEYIANNIKKYNGDQGKVLKDMKDGALGARDALIGIFKGLSTDPRITNMMTAQMDSFLGQLSNLKDKLFFMLKDAGSPINQFGRQVIVSIGKVVDWLGRMMAAFNQLSPGMKNFIIITGITVAALGPFLFILGTVFNAVSSFIGIRRLLSQVTVIAGQADAAANAELATSLQAVAAEEAQAAIATQERNITLLEQAAAQQVASDATLAFLATQQAEADATVAVANARLADLTILREETAAKIVDAQAAIDLAAEQRVVAASMVEAGHAAWAEADALEASIIEKNLITDQNIALYSSEVDLAKATIASGVSAMDQAVSLEAQATATLAAAKADMELIVAEEAKATALLSSGTAALGEVTTLQAEAAATEVAAAANTQFVVTETSKAAAMMTSAVTGMQAMTSFRVVAAGALASVGSALSSIFAFLTSTIWGVVIALGAAFIAYKAYSHSQTAAVDNAYKAAEKEKLSAQSAVKSSQAQGAEIENLVNKYTELTGVKKRSSYQNVILQQTIKRLTDLVGTNKKLISEQTGMFNGNTSEALKMATALNLAADAQDRLNKSMASLDMRDLEKKMSDVIKPTVGEAGNKFGSAILGWLPGGTAFPKSFMDEVASAADYQVYAVRAKYHDQQMKRYKEIWTKDNGKLDFFSFAKKKGWDVNDVKGEKIRVDDTKTFLQDMEKLSYEESAAVLDYVIKQNNQYSDRAAQLQSLLNQRQDLLLKGKAPKDPLTDWDQMFKAITNGLGDNKNSGGKTPAEKATDSLQNHIDDLRKSIALAGDTSEVAALQWELAFGQFKLAPPAMKQTAEQLQKFIESNKEGWVDSYKLREEVRKSVMEMEASSDPTKRAALAIDTLGVSYKNLTKDQIQQIENLQHYKRATAITTAELDLMREASISALTAMAKSTGNTGLEYILTYLKEALPNDIMNIKTLEELANRLGKALVTTAGRLSNNAAYQKLSDESDKLTYDIIAAADATGQYALAMELLGRNYTQIADSGMLDLIQFLMSLRNELDQTTERTDGLRNATYDLWKSQAENAGDLLAVKIIESFPASLVKNVEGIKDFTEAIAMVPGATKDLASKLLGGDFTEKLNTALTKAQRETRSAADVTGLYALSLEVLNKEYAFLDADQKKRIAQIMAERVATETATQSVSLASETAKEYFKTLAQNRGMVDIVKMFESMAAVLPKNIADFKTLDELVSWLKVNAKDALTTVNQSLAKAELGKLQDAMAKATIGIEEADDATGKYALSMDILGKRYQSLYWWEKAYLFLIQKRVETQKAAEAARDSGKDLAMEKAKEMAKKSNDAYLTTALEKFGSTMRQEDILLATATDNIGYLWDSLDDRLAGMATAWTDFSRQVTRDTGLQNMQWQIEAAADSTGFLSYALDLLGVSFAEADAWQKSFAMSMFYDQGIIDSTKAKTDALRESHIKLLASMAKAQGNTGLAYILENMPEVLPKNIDDLNKMGDVLDRISSQTLKDVQKVLEREKYAEFIDGVKDIFTQAFEDMYTNGFQSFYDSVASGFTQLLQKLAAEYLASQLFSLLMKGLGGIGIDISSVGGALGSILTGKALGGSVSEGQAYMVGERGPELFVAGASGTIIPNDKLPSQSVNVVFNIHTPDVAGFKRSQQQIAASASRAMARAAGRA